MAIVRKTISLTEEHHQYVRARVKSGDYGSDSEVLRDALREKIERETQNQWLIQEIQKGIESGYSEMTTEDVFDRAKARFKARHDQNSV